MNESIAVAPVDGHVLPGLGSRLQHERERLGLSPLDAAESLNLDPGVIEALEAERFELVGPAVYAKGHLKQYAALLQLPGDEIAAAYESLRAQSVRPEQALEALPEGAPMASAPAAAGRAGLLAGIAAVAAVALAAALAIVGGSHSRSNPAGSQARPAESTSSDAASNETATPDATTPDAATREPASAVAAANRHEAVRADAAAHAPRLAGDAAVPATGANRVARGTPAPDRPGSGHVRMRLSFTNDCLVTVRDANGTTLFHGKGAANSAQVIAGTAPLTVYLGSVSGVQMEVNGRTIAIGSDLVHGDAARFEAGADGVLRHSLRAASRAR